MKFDWDEKKARFKKDYANRDNTLFRWKLSCDHTIWEQYTEIFSIRSVFVLPCVKFLYNP